MRIIYDIVVRFYYLLLFLISFWNSKAKQMIVGRRNWEQDLTHKFRKEDKVIWFHCSSLGEFEQGRPIIEEIRRRFSDYKLLLTFYSPSGFEKRKDYPVVDYVTYMPFDTPQNARKFIECVPIHIVVFIKYEFWFYFLKYLHREQIPVCLASGKFRPNQLFFKWYGRWYRRMLGFFDHIFVQDKDSKDYLNKIEIKNVTVAGDSRFDRVLAIASRQENIILFEQNSNQNMVLIAGSTWLQDEKILSRVYEDLNGKISIVIAPHEPTQKNIKRLQEKFPRNQLFSGLKGKPVPKDRVIIVDTIGHLSSLYKCGNIAYIGVGFGKGIHNILEATACGLPVIFGPKYQKFKEAVDLVNEGAAFQINNAADVSKIISKFLADPSELALKSEIARKYTQYRKGTTKIIADYLYDHYFK